MSESHRALCSDLYVNQRLNLKMDLPREREPVLDMFDRVRRQFPAMQQFRRYRDELALESDQNGTNHQWLAIRTNNIRSGSVNPGAYQDAYAFHGHVLEIAPYFLSISPLDVDYLELLFGFDLMAGGNHDQIVYEALVSQSPFGRLLDLPDAAPIDCQPLFGLQLGGREGVEAYFEIKTRSNSEGERGGNGFNPEPISVYLTLRKYGPIGEIKQLQEHLKGLGVRAEELIDTRVVPNLVVPLREAIGSNSG